MLGRLRSARAARSSFRWSSSALSSSARANSPRFNRAALLDASNEALDRYERFWGRLLALEHSEERRQEEERLQTWPLARLVRSGYTLAGLSNGRSVGRQFSRDVLRFDISGQQQQHRRQAAEHSFAPGDEAILSRNGPPLTGDGDLRDDAYRVEVCEVGPADISVTVAHADAPEFGGSNAVWRLDRVAPSVAHERTVRALSTWASPANEGTFNGSTPLRRLLVEAHGSAFAPSPSPRLRTSGLSAAEAEMGMLQQTAAAIAAMDTEAQGAAVRLNEPQRAAICRALVDGSGAHPDQPKLSLIQGPPGTGKTSTACALLALASAGSEAPLLAAADSNAAVDQLLEGLIRRGVRAVRLGRPSRGEAHLLDATLEAMLEDHPEHSDASRERAELRALRKRAASVESGCEDKREVRRLLRARARSLRALEVRMATEVLQSADVVCATLVGCGSPELRGMAFPLVVIDESTQATEPRSLLALNLAKSAVVLLGDQKQLAPTCVSQRAAREGLAESLFDRVLQLSTGTGNGKKAVASHSMLTVQYRMHPLLREFPSSHFYGGHLVDGVGAAERAPPAGFPMRAPLGVINHRGKEEASDLGMSRLNRAEARVVAAAAAKLVRAGTAAGRGGGLAARDVGIITPYAAQAVEIRRVLRQLGINGIEVRTVDGFQGREKEAILLSCVRSNADRRIGFLDDARRLNVALTRARRALLVVGCRKTLSADPTWRAFFDFSAQRGLIRDFIAPGDESGAASNKQHLQLAPCTGAG
jgi:hypothetical protein